jgi:hypothetical protein
MRTSIVLVLGLLVALAPGAFAQISGGNIYGTVTDDSGAVLPGAAVTLSSELGTRSTTTGTQGEFRFLNLERGRYKVAVTITGFTTVNRDVDVVTGENVNIMFPLKVAGVAETITVTAETPLVDVKKRGTATTLTAEELGQVPNARDPWGVLRVVPGVLVDRVNVAGNENGQQASAAGKGSTTTDKVWNLDGLNITDMSATGASPGYYDFGAFQEITVTTGGGDLNVQTGGLGINLTTKRGTNKFHGGVRGFLAHDDMASNNTPDSLANDSRLSSGLATGKGDHLQQITDYGFDLGGPIIKDKLWFYGTYGKQDIRNVRLTQTYDKTLLPSYNIKLNWQATSDTMVSAFYFVGKKQKFGRAVGFPVNETDDFLWNQDNAYVDGGLPGGLWKAEINHTFSPNFFMNAKAAYYDTGFGLFARGGSDKTYTLDYVEGEAIGSYQTYQAIRPQKTINLDGNYFFSGMGGNNELKFGFGFRNASTHSASHFNGNQLAGIINCAPAADCAPGDNVAYVWRDGITDYGGKYWSGYLGDTFSKNRFTLNAGVRFDRQTAKNFASEAPANASFPEVVPAVRFDGSDNLVEWNTLSPRVGLSYALDDARKTVLRASYANYAEQLAFGDVTDENPIVYGYLAYAWNDANNDRFVQPEEVDLGNFLYNFNVDPDEPGSLTAVNRIDRDRKPKRDNEVVVGIDREVAANFAVGMAYTWRRATDWSYRPWLAAPCPDSTNCQIITPTDYIPNPPTTSNGFTASTSSPDPDLIDAGGGGRVRTNTDGYHTTFNGLELTATKRLSNRWMGRLAASWNDWTEHWDGTPYGVHRMESSGMVSPTEWDALVQDGQVAFLSGGSGKASFYTSVKWQFYANGLVQLPWGFDLSGGVFGKQGGVYPISVRLKAGNDGTVPSLAVPAIDSTRFDNVWDVDTRLAKNFKFGDASVTLSAEVFNLLNNNVVLSRYRFANSGNFTNTDQGAEPGMGRIEEILAPRVVRLGILFSF